VLYLTPPARGGTDLAAQSFVAEEIQAIRRCNVVPLVLSDEIDARKWVDGVEVVGLPRGGVSALSTAALVAARHAPLLTAALHASSSKRDVVHALRLEEAAATLVRREHVDVIHSHFGWPAGFGGSLAAQVTGTPLVTSIRGTDILLRPQIGYGLRRDPAYDVALRHLLRRASAILTATAFMRAETVALGARPDRVRLLDKGVDTDAFRPRGERATAKSRLGISGPMVIAVGTLKKRKGFDLLVDALSQITTPATLVICGDGEELGPLQQQAAAAGLIGRVRFAGNVSRAEIPDYFAAADVFVHAAELEAAGNVVLEALASGCGVVVTDSGGPAEYVEDGVNGFVVPVGDAASLASRVETLLSTPERRERLADEGRRRVEERHQYSRMMSDLRDVYDEVCVPVREPEMRQRPQIVRP
jgi:glycosyltransferase involved in cell wall biosynthesis